MRSANEDLRVRRTEKALRQAFTKLILQKGYDAITVQDIVNEAEIARVTFYRHYKDKSGLMAAYLDDAYSSLLPRLKPLSLKDLNSDSPPIAVFYDHVKENLNFYQAIFKSQESFVVQSRIRDYLMHLIQQEIKILLPKKSFPVPLQLIALHVASSELGMVMWWIENHETYPAIYMAQVSHWINLVGVLDSIGVETNMYALAPPSKQ